LAKWPVVLVVLLLVLVTGLFLFEFVVITETELATPEATPELSAQSYQQQVNALLANASADEGAKLVESFQCVVCHRAAADRIAPSFQGVNERAGLRRPPLSASAYIYESITNPTAYVVEGFAPAMPQDYPHRLTDEQLGDIIAYLLTPGAH
jgi:mono/diheme cytochrome c family protein